MVNTWGKTPTPQCVGEMGVHDEPEQVLIFAGIRNRSKDCQNFTTTLREGKTETPTPATAGTDCIEEH